MTCCVLACRPHNQFSPVRLLSIRMFLHILNKDLATVLSTAGLIGLSTSHLLIHRHGTLSLSWTEETHD